MYVEREVETGYSGTQMALSAAAGAVAGHLLTKPTEDSVSRKYEKLRQKLAEKKRKKKLKKKHKKAKKYKKKYKKRK